MASFCTVSGTILDSAGDGIQARLEFQTLGLLNMGVSGSVFPWRSSVTTSAAGVFSTSVPSTEEAGVLMRIRVVPLVTPEQPPYEFTCLIPELPAVNLNALLPTDLAYFRRDMGAYRVAKEFANNSSLSGTLGESLGISRSPSVPSASNVLWINGGESQVGPRKHYRLMRNIVIPAATAINTTNGGVIQNEFAFYYPSSPGGFNDLRIHSLYLLSSDAAAHTSQNHWEVGISTRDNLGTTLQSVGGVATTNALSPSPVVFSPALAFTKTNVRRLSVRLTKVNPDPTGFPMTSLEMLCELVYSV